MNDTSQRAPRGDRRTALSALQEALDNASGADETLDTMLSETLHVTQDKYTSDAALCRDLVARLVPAGRLKVGYDVNGILPQAALHQGAARFAGSAPTVPLAILRALVDMLSTNPDDETPTVNRGSGDKND